MNRFVDQCRSEWRRLGVPDAVANEMAADLTADLEEAEAEGASPEEVLGNGVFDPRSFAASWATARGVVPTDHRAPRIAGRGRWIVLVSALISFFAALAGLVIVGHVAGTAVAAAVVRRAENLPNPRTFFGPPAIRVGPGLPGRLLILNSRAFQALGLVLLAIGLVGLAVTLWMWKPWAARRRRAGFDDNVGMPSFL